MYEKIEIKEKDRPRPVLHELKRNHNNKNRERVRHSNTTNTVQTLIFTRSMLSPGKLSIEYFSTKYLNAEYFVLKGRMSEHATRISVKTDLPLVYVDEVDRKLFCFK